MQKMFGATEVTLRNFIAAMNSWARGQNLMESPPLGGQSLEVQFETAVQIWKTVYMDCLTRNGLANSGLNHRVSLRGGPPNYQIVAEESLLRVLLADLQQLPTEPLAPPNKDTIRTRLGSEYFSASQVAAFAGPAHSAVGAAAAPAGGTPGPLRHAIRVSTTNLPAITALLPDRPVYSTQGSSYVLLPEGASSAVIMNMCPGIRWQPETYTASDPRLENFKTSSAPSHPAVAVGTHVAKTPLKLIASVLDWPDYLNGGARGFRNLLQGPPAETGAAPPTIPPAIVVPHGPGWGKDSWLSRLLRQSGAVGAALMGDVYPSNDAADQANGCVHTTRYKEQVALNVTLNMNGIGPASSPTKRAQQLMAQLVPVYREVLQAAQWEGITQVITPLLGVEAGTTQEDVQTSMCALELVWKNLFQFMQVTAIASEPDLVKWAMESRELWTKEEYRDPLSSRVIAKGQAVITPEGIIYDQTELQTWFESGKRTDPCSGSPLDLSQCSGFNNPKFQEALTHAAAAAVHPPTAAAVHPPMTAAAPPTETALGVRVHRGKFLTCVVGGDPDFLRLVHFAETTGGAFSPIPAFVVTFEPGWRIEGAEGHNHALKEDGNEVTKKLMEAVERSDAPQDQTNGLVKVTTYNGQVALNVTVTVNKIEEAIKEATSSAEIPVWVDEVLFAAYQRVFDTAWKEGITHIITPLIGASSAKGSAQPSWDALEAARKNYPSIQVTLVTEPEHFCVAMWIKSNWTPDELKCPIALDGIDPAEAVITPRGHIYSKAALKTALEMKRGVDPCDNSYVLRWEDVRPFTNPWFAEAAKAAAEAERAAEAARAQPDDEMTGTVVLRQHYTSVAAAASPAPTNYRAVLDGSQAPTAGVPPHTSARQPSP